MRPRQGGSSTMLLWRAGRRAASGVVPASPDLGLVGRAFVEQNGRPSLENALTPRQIVSYLERYVVGQVDAKQAVAVALRNRWRRHQLAEDMLHEIMPKNILMIGPTGCGKTEIARRLAMLAQAPFIKVEATKFTGTLSFYQDGLLYLPCGQRRYGGDAPVEP